MSVLSFVGVVASWFIVAGLIGLIIRFTRSQKNPALERRVATLESELTAIMLERGIKRR